MCTGGPFGRAVYIGRGFLPGKAVTMGVYSVGMPTSDGVL